MAIAGRTYAALRYAAKPRVGRSKAMPVPHDIEAEIYFLPPEHGGRSTSAFSGYRPQFYYEGHDWDAPQEYPDVEKVNPGEKVRAYLGFLSPQEHIGRVYPGMPFLVREGNRTVGYGVVKRILDLEKSAVNAVQNE